jgi:hypothetical protein
VYGVAPEEVNFQMFLSRGGLLTTTAGAERVTQARDTGLRPLLYALEQFVDANLVAPWYADDSGVGPYRFRFVGIDEEAEDTILRLQSAAVNAGLRTINEARAEMGMQPYDDPLDDELWSACERVVERKLPALARHADARRAICRELYQRAGGKFARWPDAPMSPAAMQIWMQEHQVDIQREQAADMAGMRGPGAPFGMLGLGAPEAPQSEETEGAPTEEEAGQAEEGSGAHRPSAWQRIVSLLRGGHRGEGEQAPGRE